MAGSAVAAGLAVAMGSVAAAAMDWEVVAGWGAADLVVAGWVVVDLEAAVAVAKDSAAVGSAVEGWVAEVSVAADWVAADLETAAAVAAAEAVGAVAQSVLEATAAAMGTHCQ